MQEIAQALREIADELRDRAERGGPSVSIKAFNANAKRKVAGWIESAITLGAFPDARPEISSLYSNGMSGVVHWNVIRNLCGISNRHWTARYDTLNPPKKRSVRFGTCPTDGTPTILSQSKADRSEAEQVEWLTEQSLAWAEVLSFFAEQLDAKAKVCKDTPETTKATRHDTKDDTPKKTKKIRTMNTRAADCARLYRGDKGQTPLKTIVDDYVSEHGGSAVSIMRVLNDNPDQWKHDT